ncbi:hypothetical protein [Paenibacillus sp. FSL L8-0506]|uniref:hypothetical protein n=1 Tax=Paenibacillus sp. FSL L8-0506 TaxID=2975335 RepID=UPI0030F97014
MEIEDMNNYIKIKFRGIKSNTLDDGRQQLIVPKGLMPLVDDEIRAHGYVTIDQGNWDDDENYLVIKIVT